MLRAFLAITGFTLAFLTQLLTLQHCATPTAPSGGARDSIGPILVLEKTTPNFQTDFKPQEIILTFDEWVKQDAKQEILISPPLELTENNVPYLRKKSLVIPLTGLELRDSVTYVVNIGAAIQDLNEGNPTENLRFVFATGPVLDSAMVSGTLVDDYEGKPLDGATFTLYGNLADTAVIKENPTYFAQTDEEGKFTVFNVRPGVYRAIALVRNAGATNYYADLYGTFKPKSLGFLDTLLTITDGTTQVGSIRLSPLPLPTKVIGLDTSTLGQIDITINQAAERVDLSSKRTDYLRYNDGDTLKLFYAEPATDTILVGRDGTYPDTIIISSRNDGEGRKPRLVKGPKGKPSASGGVAFLFNQPLTEVDTSRIDVLRDTLRTRIPVIFSLDTLYPANLTLQAPWQQNDRYSIAILPGALRALNGQSNQDTITTKIQFANPETFGTLRLKMTDLDPDVDYILSLVKSDDELVETRRYVSQRSEYDVEYQNLSPGNYTVLLIYDRNRNRRYDAGDYRFLRQPEIIKRFEIPEVRANWEVEETISTD